MLSSFGLKHSNGSRENLSCSFLHYELTKISKHKIAKRRLPADTGVLESYEIPVPVTVWVYRLCLRSPECWVSHSPIPLRTGLSFSFVSCVFVHRSSIGPSHVYVYLIVHDHETSKMRWPNLSAASQKEKFAKLLYH
jgi:hypothetical protein